MVVAGWIIGVLSFVGLGAKSPPPEPIVGGSVAGVCDWPSAVLLESGGGINVCSGVLVHPRIVLTSGHCFDPGIIPSAFQPAQVVFGEDDDAAVATIDITDCVQHPDYAFIDPWTIESDVAVCTLAEDAPAIPIVPLLMECELDQLGDAHPLTVVGSGTDVDGTSSDGVKRFATNTLDEVDSPNLLSYAVVGAACFGDSGGPVFAQLDDSSWRVAALTSGAHPDATDNSCGIGSISEFVYPYFDWIEQTAGYDLTPCLDDAGQWDPTIDCGQFPEELSGFGGDWANDCSGSTVSGFSASCGDPFDAGGSTGSTGGIDTETSAGSSTTGLDTDTGSGSSTTTGPVDPSAANTATSNATAGSSTTSPPPPTGDDSGSSSSADDDGEATGESDGCGCGRQRPSQGLGFLVVWILSVVVRRSRSGSTPSVHRCPPD